MRTPSSPEFERLAEVCSEVPAMPTFGDWVLAPHHPRSAATETEETTMNGPDRTRLPIRRPALRRSGEPDARGVSARLELDRPSGGAGGRAERAARAHRRRGVRSAEHVRRTHRDAEPYPDGRRRAEVQPVPRHRPLLPDARGDAHRAEPSRGRLRADRRVLQRVPRLLARSVPKDCAPFPRILEENGYATAAFGKWHLTPDAQQGPAGPFDRWPNGWGFDYFWGFLGGEAGQYDPVITQNQTTIGVPEGKAGQPYYLPDDMADKTIEWIHGVRAQDPSKPWFAYFSTGCAHAPHHVPKEWADKYKGKFDQGWDALREETFARQKALGVIPPDAELTPRNEAFPAWDSLPEDLRKLYARQMEVYAGLPGERRLERRARPRCDRGDGRAR